MQAVTNDKGVCHAIAITGIVIVLTMLMWIGIYVPLKKHSSSHCVHAPSSIETLIAQNSTVILLNTTEYHASNLQTCFEPNIVIETLNHYIIYYII